MDIEIPKDIYAEIEELIGSAESPVGIDAKKTHVIVIEKLLSIERRLSAIEEKLNS